MNTSSRLTISARFALLVLLTLGLVPGGRAAEHDVWMLDYGFDPSYLQVQVGDTVWWTNDDDWGDTHSTTSTQSLWDSGPVAWGYSVGLTFTYAGTFPYYCKYCYMSGTIVVLAPAPPPRPSLINPIRFPNGDFKFTVTNVVVGKTTIVQASTNLVNWTGLGTNVAAATSYPYTNTGAATFPRRFYRAIALP
jgi:plastocyanin